MKKLLKTVKEWYVQGLSWLEDGYMQVVYIAAIISELLILHKIDSDNAIVYTGMLGLHVILLYVLGYKKSCWEGDTKEYIYRDIFFAANLIIMIVGAILTGIIKAVLIMLIPIAISFVQLMLAQVLFYSYEYAKHFKIEKWLIKKIKNGSKTWYFGVLLFFPVCIVAVPLLFLAWNPIAEFAIVAGYIVSVPLISRGADEGMDIIFMFETL